MRTQAIILKKIPIREYDELVVCYTQDSGKETFQAKSVLRPTSKQASHLDLLNFVDFSLVHGNGHPIITSAYVLNSWPHLKSSLAGLAASYFLLECFDKLVFDGQRDEKLWDFLATQFAKYNDSARLNNANWPQIIASAKNEILAVMGYDSGTDLAGLADGHFKSLQFAKKVIRLSQWSLPNNAL